MRTSARLRAGHQGGQLLPAAGVSTLVDHLPGSGHLDRAVLDAVALTTTALAAALRFPWARVPVEVRAEGPAAVVEVSDEGVGIPAGAEASLFAPFLQAAPANTREHGGVGLGLYIVRQLVEAQGGTVTAHDRPEGGACFRVTLPLLAAPSTPADGATRGERLAA